MIESSVFCFSDLISLRLLSLMQIDMIFTDISKRFILPFEPTELNPSLMRISGWMSGNDKRMALIRLHLIPPLNWLRFRILGLW